MWSRSCVSGVLRPDAVICTSLNDVRLSFLAMNFLRWRTVACAEQRIHFRFRPRSLLLLHSKQMLTCWRKHKRRWNSTSLSNTEQKQIWGIWKRHQWFLKEESFWHQIIFYRKFGGHFVRFWCDTALKTFIRSCFNISGGIHLQFVTFINLTDNGGAVLWIFSSSDQIFLTSIAQRGRSTVRQGPHRGGLDT